MTGYEPPPRGFGILKRALVACVLIVAMSAAAVASAAILQVDDVLDIVREEGRAPIALPEIDAADVGGPQTLMILGSDERFDDKKNGAGRPRSDTIILVRLDKNNDAISVMSLPRDLKVTIPGNSLPTKINGAYEQGGERLTLRTVKKVLSTPGRRFKINHLVTIGFESFQRAINYVGCVYYDVDRRYYNDNAQGQNYATIDIQPGYQRICGQDSLDYVRHRHSDNDLYRAARQQDFLRQVKNQQGVRRLKDPRRFKNLATVFSRYFDSDKGLRDRKELFALAKLVIFASDKPVREIPFIPDGEEPESGYLLASEKRIKKTVDRFLSGTTATPARKPAAAKRPARKRRKASSSSSSRSIKNVPGLESAVEAGKDQAILADPKLDFPFYFPSRRLQGAKLDSGLSSEPTTRTYTIRDERGKRHRAYRLTQELAGAVPEYYGIQGTTWRGAPILDDPDEVRTVGGRKLRLYYDGRKLRLVAWRTGDAAYWVSNSLMRRLSNRQMLAIAASLRRLDGR
jgi:LCP family protein required for cell wall assembly